MEPITLAGAGIVVYCGYLALQDDLRSWRRFREGCRKRREERKPEPRQEAAAAGRADASAVRWPALSGGSA